MSLIKVADVLRWTSVLIETPAYAMKVRESYTVKTAFLLLFAENLLQGL